MNHDYFEPISLVHCFTLFYAWACDNILNRLVLIFSLCESYRRNIQRSIVPNNSKPKEIGKKQEKDKLEFRGIKKYSTVKYL